MKTKIESYRNLPGQHCGSIAMKNLLNHYCGLDLPEEVVFGLGSGIECICLESKTLDPPAVVFGRSVTMEVDVAHALGVDYRETMEMDAGKAWEDVRAEVAAGRPTMLSGDVFYLDYRKFKVHFPAHRFVLVGFDDDRKTAYIADRLDPEFQACSYEAVAASRNPPKGLSTINLWGKFHDTQVKRSLSDACLLALERNANRMLGKDTSQFELLDAVCGGSGHRLATGLKGIAMLADRLMLWRDTERAGFAASYASQAIEKFGTGGGNFRRMYASFLDWASERDPDRIPWRLQDLAARSAESWTRLAAILDEASMEPARDKAWRSASDQARSIHGIETELFETMARVCSSG